MDVELASLGRNVRRLRKARGMRLADLAEAVGYTASHISQIERGTYVPSLTALAMVAMALEVEMTTLLDSVPGPAVHITRAGEGKELRLPDDRTFQTVGSHGAEGAYSAFLLELNDDPAVYFHYGERFLLVLSGRVALRFASDHYRLGPGGTLHYAAHETHEIICEGSDPVLALIITCPALV